MMYVFLSITIKIFMNSIFSDCRQQSAHHRLPLQIAAVLMAWHICRRRERQAKPCNVSVYEGTAWKISKRPCESYQF